MYDLPVMVDDEGDGFKQNGVLGVGVLDLLGLRRFLGFIEDGLQTLGETTSQRGVLCKENQTLQAPSPRLRLSNLYSWWTSACAANRSGRVWRTWRRVALQQAQQLDGQPRGRHKVVRVVLQVDGRRRHDLNKQEGD